MKEREETSLVVLRDLRKHYPVQHGLFSRTRAAVKAVDGVSLSIMRGETLGLVGESGCGKSTLGRLILRFEEPTTGSIYFEGRNILEFGRKQMRHLRREMQIIFQDPFSSLDPRKKVSSILAEPFIVHKLVANKRERQEKVLKLMELVGLRPDQSNRYPQEFSGGQRQRIGIARALALNPKLIIADEPISSLDLSIQAQVVNLLVDLQLRLGLTYLFISHDLRVVHHVSDRVAVMYLGKIVELADGETLYNDPVHPYSEALVGSAPIPNPKVKRKKILLEGDVPSPINPPSGCRFHTRCPIRKDLCSREDPPLEPRANGSIVACHFR
ncbi:MAG: dipeptide ABC transporter ATP-binding protein [Deltaproteobacteria bacterium]|nr:dipeptide ABC transporter ATP-binding protein [Deltaproteobacteria bacterium]MBW2120618.1 dipeptide ABC transporter ATP-binding protein [Deltaproteobacteria bacterium]